MYIIIIIITEWYTEAKERQNKTEEKTHTQTKVVNSNFSRKVAYGPYPTQRPRHIGYTFREHW